MSSTTFDKFVGKSIYFGFAVALIFFFNIVVQVFAETTAPLPQAVAERSETCASTGQPVLTLAEAPAVPEKLLYPQQVRCMPHPLTGKKVTTVIYSPSMKAVVFGYRNRMAMRLEWWPL